MNSFQIQPIQGNGRVQFKQPDTPQLFNLYDKVPVMTNDTFRDSISNMWEQSPLSIVYFSRENIQILQNGIRAGIYEKTSNQHRIDNQNVDQLKIIMRSIFIEHAKHQKSNIPMQIQELNTIVLNYCIEQIYTELVSYLKYIDDISKMHVPNSRPVMTNESKCKQLEYKPWF